MLWKEHIKKVSPRVCASLWKITYCSPVHCCQDCSHMPYGRRVEVLSKCSLIRFFQMFFFFLQMLRECLRAAQNQMQGVLVFFSFLDTIAFGSEMSVSSVKIRCHWKHWSPVHLLCSKVPFPVPGQCRHGHMVPTKANGRRVTGKKRLLCIKGWGKGITNEFVALFFSPSILIPDKSGLMELREIVEGVICSLNQGCLVPRNFKGALFILCPVFLNAVVFSDCAQEVSLYGKTLKKCF